MTRQPITGQPSRPWRSARGTVSVIAVKNARGRIPRSTVRSQRSGASIGAGSIRNPTPAAKPNRPIGLIASPVPITCSA